MNSPLPSTLVSFIWRYLKLRKLYLAGYLLIAIIWAVELSLSPYLLKVIIDAVVHYQQDHVKLIAAIFWPAIIFVSMSVFLNINFRLHDYINLRLFPEIKSSAAQDMFGYLLGHSYTFFQNNFAGSLTKKIADMVVSIESIVSIIKVWFVPRILALIISSATLFAAVQPIFGVILFLWTIVFVCFSYVEARRSEKISREFSEAAAKMDGTMSDSISNMMSTKLFANIPQEIEHLNIDMKHLVACDRALAWKSLKANAAQGVLVSLLVGSMLFALIDGCLHGSISAGDFALVLMLVVSFITSVENIGQQMLEFSKVVGRCNQALSFIKIPHEIVDHSTALPINIKHGVIKFERVTFRYENNPPLFEDLDVTIHSGEKVGLVGYSGGGKSSFIKLILRLIDIQAGKILIDDQDIQTVTQQSLRKQIGTIPQDPELFHRSIMENIRFANAVASDEEVIEAAKKAGCHEFIMQLPDQYQSLVGERGIKLSGGQKQRIAIARAFLKDAPILLLDEATSSLDSVTERYIQNNLHAVMAGKTTIVIAHRLSTLKGMDRILVFDKGCIVQDGALDELLKDVDGLFYKLWHMQAAGFLPATAGE